MKLEVLRYSSGKHSTLGVLSDITDGKRKFLCYTLEDEYNEVKVAGSTRIPAGTYGIKLRNEGEKNEHYKAKYGSMHKGMLWIQDVPNFQWILIHVGNTDKDTAGCLLVGNSSFNNITEEGTIGSSVDAYKRIYPAIANAILKGETVTIEYINNDTLD